MAGDKSRTQSYRAQSATNHDGGQPAANDGKNCLKPILIFSRIGFFILKEGKGMHKKNIVLSLRTAVLILFLNCSQAQAEKILQLQTYFPSPVGRYANLTAQTGQIPNLKSQLIGLTTVNSSLFASNCSSLQYVNSMALNENGFLMFCTEEGVVVGVPSVWKEESDKVYLIPDKKVGLGTDTPTGKLSINGGALFVAGDLAAGDSNPSPSAGTQFFFWPEKSALRAVTVEKSFAEYATDDKNIGDYSFAAGLNVKASGKAAIALGERHQAMGWHSAAIGGWKNTISVKGLQAIILGGQDNLISADGAIIIGGNKIKNEKKDAIVIGYHPSANNFSVTNQKSMVLLSERIGVNTNPSATFEVEGSVLLGNDKEKGYAVRNGENAYLSRGYVTSAGALTVSDTNAVSVTRTALGTYQINFTNFNLNDIPFIQVTSISAAALRSQMISLTAKQAVVKFFNIATSLPMDTNFTFLLMGTLNSAKDGVLDIQAGQGVNFGQ